MLWLISPFLGVIGILAALGCIGVEILSGARAFVGGESVWSRAEKQASLSLARYVETHDEADYRRFKQSIRVPLGDRRARLELDQDRPDLAVVRQGFLDGGNAEADVAGMIRVYRHFGRIGDVRRAVELWSEGDALIVELDAIADELRTKIGAGLVESDAPRVLIARAAAITDRLTPMEEAFSAALGEAARRAELTLLGTLLLLPLSLVALAFDFSRRMSKRNAQIEAALQQRDAAGQKEVEAAIRRQAMQQGLIAEFGQLALENPDLDDLFERAVAIASEGLQAPLSRLLALGDDGRTLVLKAGRGWEPPWRDQARFDAAEETRDRFILGTRSSIVIDDFEQQHRFARSAILAAHRVRSAVETLICSTAGPCAVLGVYTAEPGRFDRDCGSFLQAIGNALAAAIDRKLAEERLTYLAQFDVATDLPNRLLYLDRLARIIAAAEAERRAVGVLFVDLDRFKIVNDTMGHAAGDELLLMVARRLHDCVRSGDAIGRLGGDEFALALASMTKADDAGVVAAKVVEALRKPFDVAGQKVYISASVGVSAYPVDGADPDTLLRHADTAMYRAKETGRSTWCAFRAEMNQRAVERMALDRQLRGALERNEFVLHYQPRVGLGDGRITGFEALLRWRHPERGLVMPGEFIGILEDTGMIVPVGEWVLREVCRQIAAWQAAGLALRPVAVNLSPRQFGQKGLDAMIGEALMAAEIRPDLLELELTESMLMADPAAAARTLKRIKARGIRVAVDDFGTGYSSLARLKRFRLDALKIDRVFVRDVATDPDAATIAVTIIKLAHSLNMGVVAEGVETQSQVDFLRAHRCDEMQGWHFAPALPVAECTDLLRADRTMPLPRATERPAALAVVGRRIAAG